MGYKMIIKNGQHLIDPEWDTDVRWGKLDVIRKTVLKKYGFAKSFCWTKVSSREGTNLCTCNNCTNRPGKSQSDVRSNELDNDPTEDDSSSDDKCHGAMDNDELNISYHNQDYDLLKLMNLLSDEEDNGDDQKAI